MVKQILLISCFITLLWFAMPYILRVIAVVIVLIRGTH